MSGGELGLAIVATVDLCFKYGKLLVEVCDRFQKAESQISERAVRIRAIWLRARSQLDCVRQLAPLLSEEHCDIQAETLKIFSNKLDLAITKLQSFLKKADGDDPSKTEWHVSKSKYALFGKSLDEVIDDLNVWHKVFDQSWYLIMLAAKPQIGAELEDITSQSSSTLLTTAQTLRGTVHGTAPAAPIFLPSEELDTLEVSKIPYSSVDYVDRHGSGRNLILERITCLPQVDAGVFRKSIRNLARRLSHADPTTFGLLHCKGVVEQKPTNDQPQAAFTLVFRIPRNLPEPRSLRSYLLEGNRAHSLSDRFRIATQLAQSVGSIHSFGFVHKNVLPETVLLFGSATKSGLGMVSLVGFGNFRDAEASTLRSGDSRWEKNIYRHPRRQGLTPSDDYIMQHDIYSLGVCLLEIGLWASFVVYDGNAADPTPSAVLGLAEGGEIQNPFAIKDRLLSLAGETLPQHMGTRYSEIVETCLTCLDQDNVDFGDEREFLDEDGILVGVRYIEKVVLRLNTICV